ncbi:hypothetical protein [Salinibaculum salinum]|uniref:hypothetical protein n=1 Tax=Salinibaculum salinum TaxID=3131996 RepID=UPI0030EBA49F
METIQFEDPLESLGMLTGVLLVLIGLGTLVGQPWATADSTIAVVLQLVGVVVTVALGAGLVWLSYE